MKENFKNLHFLLDAFKNFAKHDGMVMAGHLAFLTMLALFPFIIFLVSLAGFFGQSDAGAQALVQLFEHIPEDVGNVLQGPIEKMIQTTDKSIMTFSILGAMWISSSAIDAARLAIVRAFGTVSRRSYIRRRAEGLMLVILSASSIIIGMTILVLGPVAWNILISYIPLEADWKLIWNLVRMSVSISLIFGALCLSYYILKPRKLGRHSPVMAGAFTSLSLWMIIGGGFSIYLKYFGNYDVTYGSLAGAIIALIFFYFIGASYILGAEVNAALYHQRSKKIAEKNPAI
ncbi:Inner membrane protein YihY, formerly thought to be RNase BN [hydrothermal vent metagenome]|uniref:Inner membrane protein YihY, formerly thought to be RNase BN n=1 Tax=hydrothermal vent metagenome TaxID=652676 RepID=A0A3B1AWC9_9ZZZZ